MTPIIMHGAAGRMGRRILALAAERPDAFRIVQGVDQKPAQLRDLGIAADGAVVTALPDDARGAVVIDFSHPSSFPALVRRCAELGCPLVSGTTGIEPAALAAAVDAAAGRIPVLHAGNMSVGVNVLCAVAAQLARALGPEYDIEIVEAHHHHKVDAPSGTAFALADAILEATGRTRADLIHGREGQVGARTKGEIGMHALRLGDVVGDHTVYFVGNGERVLIGHVAHTRDIFARGALRAAAFLHGRAPGRYAMRQVLGL
jgi:4-hydroxy-tetrahydrodipicolinate reductase